MAQKQPYTCPGSTSHRTCLLSPLWPPGKLMKLFKVGQGREEGHDDSLTFASLINNSTSSCHQIFTSGHGSISSNLQQDYS